MDSVLAAPVDTRLVRRAVSAHRSSRRRRAVVVTSALGGIAVTLFVVTMLVGSSGIGPWDVIASLLGIGTDPATDFIVRELRLPTAATGLAVGLALGVSGLLFQQLLDNPLASPDFVGVSSGASLFAVSSIILFEVSRRDLARRTRGGAHQLRAGLRPGVA